MNEHELLGKVDHIWHYSRYYGDMLFTSKRLYQNDEYYASVLLLFNATELIFKSTRENYNEKFNQDLQFLKERGDLNNGDYDFLNSKNSGMREIRNIMMHRDAYQHCLEDSYGIAHMFSENDTWKMIYESYFPKLICIIHSIILERYGVIK